MKHRKTITYKKGGEIHTAEVKPDYVSGYGVYAFVFEKWDGSALYLFDGELIEIN